MRREINRRRINSYRASLAKYGVSPQALKWKNERGGVGEISGAFLGFRY